MATAPLGGCNESVVIIKKMDNATARLSAMVGFGIHNAQLTPIIAAILLPTIKFQGCDNGLADTAKSNTDVAPIGAIYHALKPPSTYQLMNEEIARPMSAPSPQNTRSLKGKTLKLGFKVFNQFIVNSDTNIALSL